MGGWGGTSCAMPAPTVQPRRYGFPVQIPTQAAWPYPTHEAAHRQAACSCGTGAPKNGLNIRVVGPGPRSAASLRSVVDSIENNDNLKPETLETWKIAPNLIR